MPAQLDQAYEVIQECRSGFANAAQGNVEAGTAYNEFNDWLTLEIETAQRIQEEGYYENQQRY